MLFIGPSFLKIYPNILLAAFPTLFFPFRAHFVPLGTGGGFELLAESADADLPFLPRTGRRLGIPRSNLENI